MISIIMPTYNRAHTLKRAIDSVVVQDYPAWELIIVDDASTDDTQQLLQAFTDPRIKVLTHTSNRGVTAALNTGLDAIEGDWFTRFDSDDELAGPNVLSTLLGVLDSVDPRINAITCNCLDTSTGEFSGIGLNHDQFLDAETITRKCHGEYWGLTKTELLQGERFNEELRGYEDVLWHRINKRALRYYIHKALRIYHTEGDDRICGPSGSLGVKEGLYYARYVALLGEEEYLADLRSWNIREYINILFSAGLSFVESDDKKRALYVAGKLLRIPTAFPKASLLTFGTVFGHRFIDLLKSIRRSSTPTHVHLKQAKRDGSPKG